MIKQLGLIPFITISIGLSTSYGQVELTVGTTWEYDYDSVFGGTGSTYSAIAKDTIIQDKACLILEREFQNCNERDKRDFIYQESDSLYYYDKISEEFRLLYDFSANVGDTIQIKSWLPWSGFITDFLFIVDSISTINIGTTEARWFSMQIGSIRTSGEIRFDDYYIEVIEGLGATTNFFFWVEDGGCDGARVDGLTCFHSPELGQYSPAGQSCRVSDLESPIELISEYIYPNPATDKLTLISKTKTIQIYNMTGKLVLSQPYNNLPIEVSHLNPGVYFLRTDTNLHKLLKE